METFIQFYNVQNNLLVLRNGFSSVWNVIKERGDILWINPKQEILPDVSEIVYISCGFENEFPFIEKLVLNNPDSKFIVGGPAVNYMNFRIDAPNFQGENKYMFELLDVIPTSEMWGLELPNVKFKNVSYNYSLSFGNKCYWGKCNFCNRKAEPEIDLVVKNIPIIKPDSNMVWLNKLSITPKDILNVFPLLDNRSYYSFFLRGDSGVLNSLNQVKFTKKFRPMIGVEFPSNRMLGLMNKGTTTENLLDVMKVFLQNNCNINITLIHAWVNLIDDDVLQVEKFLTALRPYRKQIYCSIIWLFSHVEELNTIPYTTKYGKTYYLYKQTKKQKELNDNVLKLYKSFGFAEYTEAGMFKNFFTDSGVLDE